VQVQESLYMRKEAMQHHLCGMNNTVSHTDTAAKVQYMLCLEMLLVHAVLNIQYSVYVPSRTEN